jgi:uncharacterized surface protein with fasciclin (FAS1) repeats
VLLASLPWLKTASALFAAAAVAAACILCDTAVGQAADIQVPADASWTIFAPNNAAFADPGVLEKTGLTAQQLLLPANKATLTKVTHL